MLTKPAAVITQIAGVVLFFWGIGQIPNNNGLVAVVAMGIGLTLFLYAGHSTRKRIALDHGRQRED